MKTAIAVCMLLAACTSPSESYIKADEATKDVIAPEYLRYVRADETLDEAQKARRERLVKSWELRISKAKEDL